MTIVRYSCVPPDQLADPVRIRALPRLQTYLVEVDETGLDPLLAVELEKASPDTLVGLSWRDQPADRPSVACRVHRVRDVPGGRLVAVDLEVPGLIDVLVDADLMRPGLERHMSAHATTALRLMG